MRSLRRVVRTRPRPRPRPPGQPPGSVLAAVRWGAPVVLILALALALTACAGKAKSPNVASLNGASNSPTASTVSQDPYQQALAFARCMRQHGIKMADPKQSANGGIEITVGGPGDKPNKAKMDAAQSACQKYAPQGKGARKQGPSDQEFQQALAFARCMRQHGVNMPDPKRTSGGIEGSSGSLDPNSAKFKTAQAACQNFLPRGAGVGNNTSGGSGSGQGGKTG